MKVEQPPRITQTVSVSSPPLPPRPSYSTESTLVSPYAPTFPRLSRFFTWLWDWIRSIFQSPEKPKPAPAPSPAALQAIQIAQAEKEAASESWLDTPTLGIGLLGVSLCYWQWERVHPIATAIPGKIMAIPGVLWSMVPSMIATAANSALNSKIEQKARQYLPAATPGWMIKGASLTAASAAVWYTSDYLGYPMGQAYLGFLSRLTFQGIPSMVAPFACSYLTNYYSPEKIFWGVLAFNVARYAQASFSSAPVQQPKYTETT